MFTGIRCHTTMLNYAKGIISLLYESNLYEAFNSSSVNINNFNFINNYYIPLYYILIGMVKLQSTRKSPWFHHV